MFGRDGEKWDYSTERGPEQWGDLSPDYVLAAIGGSQSPINIVTKDVITADLPPLEFETHPTELKVLNNGHTIEVLAPGGSTLEFRGQKYTLMQYHFHSQRIINIQQQILIQGGQIHLSTGYRNEYQKVNDYTNILGIGLFFKTFQGCLVITLIILYVRIIIKR